MNLVYVAVFIASSAVCFGNALPADFRVWRAGSEGSQAKLGDIDFTTHEIEARCSPGLWCVNNKRETQQQNPAPPKQISVRPAQKRKARAFRCLPGLLCLERRTLTEGTKNPIQRFPNSDRGQMADCVKYPFLCREKAWPKLKEGHIKE